MIKSIQISAIQLFLYFMTIQLGLNLVNQWHSEYKLGIQFGISLTYSYLIIFFLYTIANYCNRNRFSILIKCILVLLFLYYWKESIHIHPLRIYAVIAITIFSYYIPILVYKLKYFQQFNLLLEKKEKKRAKK
jgi:hypothetical protein